VGAGAGVGAWVGVGAEAGVGAGAGAAFTPFLAIAFARLFAKEASLIFFMCSAILAFSSGVFSFFCGASVLNKG
jgi:hypothetical protein